jgi:hypothetical protein
MLEVFFEICDLVFILDAGCWVLDVGAGCWCWMLVLDVEAESFP